VGNLIFFFPSSRFVEIWSAAAEDGRNRFPIRSYPFFTNYQQSGLGRR
jgi:hypothetical protein